MKENQIVAIQVYCLKLRNDTKKDSRLIKKRPDAVC